MKNKFLKILLICLSGIFVFFTGCKKPLETIPKNSLDLTFALGTKEGIQATLIAIYNSMQGSGYYGRDFIVIPEVLSDNCEITSNNSNRFIAQANNTPNNHVGIWTTAYTNINRANLVLSYAEGSSATAAEKAQWKGEAYFLRALLYHDLVKSYARAPLYLNSGTGGTFDLGVPIITTPVVDANKITFPARNKVSEVYDQIMLDLNAANSLLTNSGIAYRPRRVAVHALASRVELYRGNWAQAERWADSVLLQNVVPLSTAPATYFNNTSPAAPAWGNAHPETIFGIFYKDGEGTAGTDGLQYIYYRNLAASPAIQGYADITMQTSLRNDMGVVGTTSTDQRFAKLVSPQIKSSQQVFYCVKWPGLRALGQDDIMLLRTTEILLNRAEARAMQGGAKEALAIGDLNQTRTRGGLTAFPTSGAGAPTGTALVNEILKERRIELAFEGHRLFDILRTGRDVVKNPASIVYGTNAYNYLIANVLQADLDANPALIKNPGY